LKPTPEATEGQHLFGLADKLWNIPELREMMGKVLPEKGKYCGLRSDS